MAHFGEDTPLARAGQPAEVASAFVFLASEQDASYVSGTVLGVTGGQLASRRYECVQLRRRPPQSGRVGLRPHVDDPPPCRAGVGARCVLKLGLPRQTW
ncbi:SDR family oxidoreductase [Aeromicrobium sp. Root495]|uniref:SDR family oxidoreductase n=1 Tax=Aeromicrobium sp. Root495 TaxID=1736550 RepID=UPI0022853C88|nr:SDR family oxidoreductase [Aeromicrobium sp. Root495]